MQWFIIARHNFSSRRNNRSYFEHRRRKHNNGWHVNHSRRLGRDCWAVERSGCKHHGWRIEQRGQHEHGLFAPGLAAHSSGFRPHEQQSGSEGFPVDRQL